MKEMEHKAFCGLTAGGRKAFLKSRSHRRFLSLLLSIVMVVGMLPVISFEAMADGAVCRIDSIEYNSVQEAVDALRGQAAGKTITMIADVNLTSTIMVYASRPAFTLDLNGHTISGANIPVPDTDSEGSVISNQTVLTIKDSSSPSTGKITGGLGRRVANARLGALYYGGGIINYANATLTLEGGSICNNGSKNDLTTNYGGGIYNMGTLIITGGAIENNEAAYGGGIRNEKGTVIIQDGSITENKAASFCGGVYNNGGRLEMTGGAIAKNEGQWGGGIYNSGDGTVIIKGGSITENKAVNTSLSYSVGGGIYNTKGSLTIEGGNISNNAAIQTDASKPYGQGGGIYNTSSGTVTISDGAISGNKGSRGGGISNFGTLVITGGEITGNYGFGYEKDESKKISESEGVAGVLNCYGTMTMTGGTISNNIADKEEWGGGVCNRSEGSKKAVLTVGGTAVISGNTAASKPGNVMQYMKAGATEVPVIAVSTETPLTSGAAIGLSVQDENYDKLYCIVSGATDTDKQYFSNDDSDNYELRFVSDHLELAASVKFDLQGRGTEIEKQYVLYGNKISKPADPAEEGYAFGGWYQEAACENAWDFDTDTVAAVTTLYAKWFTMPKALSPTAKGRSDGKIIYVDSTMEYSRNDGSTWTDVTGTEITGLSEGETVWVRVKATASKEIRLTVPDFEEFSVTFNMMGHGSEIPVATASTATPSVPRPTDPTESGWTFVDWFTAPDFSKVWDFVNDLVTESMTLFAKWITKVTYDANNATAGTVPVDEAEYLDDDIVTVLDNTGKLERTGYTFAGWNTEADGTGTSYQAGDTFTIPAEGNVILYAKWTRNGSDDDDDDSSSTSSKPAKTGTWDDPVTDGTWKQGTDGKWTYTTNAAFRNTWGYILNPYAKTEADKYAWFWFDANGKMVTGWVKINGNWFYFNEISDGTLGAMKQGWITWNGNRYYLTETRDSNGGKMLANTTTPDGHVVDESGKRIR